jgi:hypothetical protein
MNVCMPDSRAEHDDRLKKLYFDAKALRSPTVSCAFLGTT